MTTKVKRREWVKTAAIVFLSVLLVLTFFSNTIMNRSLPEVAAQYVESGTINARIRGTGTVSANEVYDVSLTQTRKVQSVLVKVGQEVSAGDPLFRLESTDSEELKAAQTQLESMELNYQKSLIEAGNAASTEDREIQKLREAYDSALRIYRIYTNITPEQLELRLKEAEQYLAATEQTQQRLEQELEFMKNDPGYLDTKSEAEALQANYDAAIAAHMAAEAVLIEIDTLEDEIKELKTQISNDYGSYSRAEEEYERFIAYVGDDSLDLETASTNVDFFLYIASVNGYTLNREDAEKLQEVYRAVSLVVDKVENLPDKSEAQANVNEAAARVDVANTARKEKQDLLDYYENNIKAYENGLPEIQSEIFKQQKVVAELRNASTAGAAVIAAEEALEDALFRASLGESANLDMQSAKEAIEAQKKLIEELTQQADGQDITAPVGGTVTAINVTAGNTAGAEQVIAQITVADRGYTVPISVTAEQARQVRVGDTAEITNYYWGDITATLENIASDPQSMGKNKMLIFRIEGEGVEAGTNLTLSIGQRSANYDCLVPNSAVRSDSNGSFVLVVEAKSSPLGNRYVATRADVKVLASDDTTSAVSGLSNGDFVITTSNRPLEAGELVRLPDNG